MPTAKCSRASFLFNPFVPLIHFVHPPPPFLSLSRSDRLSHCVVKRSVRNGESDSNARKPTPRSLVFPMRYRPQTETAPNFLGCLGRSASPVLVSLRWILLGSAVSAAPLSCLLCHMGWQSPKLLWYSKFFNPIIVADASCFGAAQKNRVNATSWCYCRPASASMDVMLFNRFWTNTTPKDEFFS